MKQKIKPYNIIKNLYRRKPKKSVCGVFYVLKNLCQKFAKTMPKESRSKAKSLPSPVKLLFVKKTRLGGEKNVRNS
jgi:hypothetical protein